jgi:hypothetical protein
MSVRRWFYGNSFEMYSEEVTLSISTLVSFNFLNFTRLEVFMEVKI